MVCSDATMLAVWAIALVKLALHTYFNDGYGFFRDEFDYLSCGEHFDWGYVDQPPLIPWLTELSRLVLGESLRAVRFIPALASLYAMKPIEVPIAHEERFAGRSKYSIYSLIRLNFDLITGFSVVPLQLFSMVGMAVAVLSALLVAYLFV